MLCGSVAEEGGDARGLSNQSQAAKLSANRKRVEEAQGGKKGGGCFFFPGLASSAFWRTMWLERGRGSFRTAVRLFSSRCEEESGTSGACVASGVR